MSEDEISFESTGGLFYSWMPNQEARPYGSYVRPKKYIQNKKDLCKRCSCDISELTIRSAKRKYCDSCNLAIYKEKNRNRHVKKILLPRTCKECLNIFTPKKKTTAEFCSNTCWSKNKRFPSKPKICNECHNEIALSGNRKYCSKICRDISIHRRAIIKLENLRRNPN